MTDLRAMAKVWKARAPSGKFILHTIPHDRNCPRHGAVTKWHSCPVTHPKFWGPPLVAKSAWVAA